MPSPFESLFASTAAVSLLEFHGETVRRTPVGGAPEDVVAIVMVEAPEVSKDKGDARVFKPRVLVADSVSNTIADKWVINGVTYWTENIAPINGDGLRPVELKKNDKNIGTAK